MALYYKYLDALAGRFELIGEKAESKLGNWTNNVVDLFYNAKRYHLYCKLGERNSVYIHYYTSKNENNLVSFTLLKKFENLDVIQHFNFLINIQKIRKMKLCMSRDCLDDLERLEETNINFILQEIFL